MEFLKKSVLKAKQQFGDDIIFSSNICSILDDFGAFVNTPSYKYIIRELASTGFIKKYFKNLPNQTDIIYKINRKFGFETSTLQSLFESLSTNSKDMSKESGCEKIHSKVENQLIFLVDCSELRRVVVSDLRVQLLNNIKRNIGNTYRVSILCYNETAWWLYKQVEPSSISVEGFMMNFGVPRIEVAFDELNNLELDWMSMPTAPILVWLPMQEPKEPLNEIINKAKTKSVLLHIASKFIIKFGYVSEHTLGAFESEVSHHIEGLQHTLIWSKIFQVSSLPILWSETAKTLIYKQAKENISDKKLDKSSVPIVPVRKGQYWGWYKLNTGIFISPRFTKVKQFSEGLAAVAVNINAKEKWGFINCKGEIIIDTIYEEVQDMVNGVICVKFDGKYGCITKEGQIIIPFEHYYTNVVKGHFIEVIDMGNSYRQISEGFSHGIFSLNGHVIVPIAYDNIIRKNDYFVGIYCDYIFILDSNGQNINSIPFNNFEDFDIRNIIKIKNKYDKVGLINIDGSVLIEMKYDKIELEQSLKIIVAQNGSKTDLYKEWGRKINDLPISEYVIIEENRYYVKMDDNEWKIMDDYGRCTNIEVTPILYIFKDGSILSTSLSKRNHTPLLSYILISPNGAKQRVFTIYNSQELDNVQIYEEGDFIVIRRYSRIYRKTINYWLNKYNGKILVPYKGKWNNNRSTVTVSQPSEGLFIQTEHIPALYENDDKFSLNLSTGRGKLIFEAFESSTIHNFNTGEEVGIREMDGKIEHRSFYGRISQFHNGFAVIKYDNLSKYINKNAEEVFEYYSEAKDFSEGYGVVKSHKGYGIIDEKGMLVVPCLFDEIGRIQKNYIYG